MSASSVGPALLVLAALAVGACGGGEEAPPSGTPASEPPPPELAPPAAESGGAAAESAPGAEAVAGAPAGTPEATTPEAAPQQAGETLMREIFVYRSSGRDPFLPLSAMENIRPFIEDLRVTGITFDARYPGNSIAVLRDTSSTCGEDCRYTVRVGDEVGQVRVLEIRSAEVIVVREQFGIEQQIILPLRRR